VLRVYTKRGMKIVHSYLGSSYLLATSFFNILGAETCAGYCSGRHGEQHLNGLHNEGSCHYYSPTTTCSELHEILLPICTDYYFYLVLTFFFVHFRF